MIQIEKKNTNIRNYDFLCLKCYKQVRYTVLWDILVLGQLQRYYDLSTSAGRPYGRQTRKYGLFIKK